MTAKAFIILSFATALSIFQSCLPNCGGDGPDYFELNSTISQARYYGTGPYPVVIDTGSFSTDSIALELILDELTYVGAADVAPAPFFQGFASTAYACSPAPPRSRYDLTAMRIYPTADIEFDVMLNEGEDISSYFRVSEDRHGAEYGLQEYIDLEYQFYEYSEYIFYFAEDLGAPYSGSFEIQLQFSDGSKVSSTTQELNLY